MYSTVRPTPAHAPNPWQLHFRGCSGCMGGVEALLWDPWIPPTLFIQGFISSSAVKNKYIFFFCLFLFFCSGVGWRISLQSSCAEGLRSMAWTTRRTNPLLSFNSTLEQLSSSMPSLHLLLYSQYPPEKLLRHISDLCWSSIRIFLFSVFHYVSYPPRPF